MKKPVFVLLLGLVPALALAAPALAQDSGSVRDFQIPAEGAAPGPVQGPVTEGVAPPRVTRTARPTPAPTQPVETQPAPAASAAPDPLSAIDAMARDRAAARPPAARVAATPTPASQTSEQAAPASLPVTAGALPAARSAVPQAAGAADKATAQTNPAPADGWGWWPWLVALLAVGAIGAAAGWFWRGRRAGAPMQVPQIERPRVPARMPEPSGPPAELPKVALTRKDRKPAAPAPVVEVPDEEEIEAPLGVALEPARLSVSLLNATLAYRILLTNRGETPLRDISIDGDMISAHASLPDDEQVAALNSKLENRHLVRTLAPGETKVVRGEFALPLPLIRPIRRGEAALFVPLARLRVVTGGDGAQVLVQTSVVGQRSNRPGGGLRPFRLDLGPRIYSELAQRAFA